jgi:esterase/lipase superfamily enzyme
MPHPSRAFLAAVSAAIVLALAGCQTKLMPTPNIYAGGEYELFGDLHPALRTNEVEILYVTDRVPLEPKGGRLRYGHERSRSMAFGSSVVEIGRDVSWETLLRESTSRKRSVSLPLQVDSITELGRFPQTPLPIVEQNGRLMEDPEITAQTADVEARFRDEVAGRLARTPAKEVFVYIHGFHNTFDYAAAVTAEFWHFAGRAGVPILYSWPAGAPGLLRGYTHDRDSGEFTIPHLKHFLRLIASVPEVERIHVVAHSRGTHVLTGALHELVIENLAMDRDPRQTLKIANVVLASPDIDLEVFFQRFFGEQFFRGAQHVTIYVSKKDNAIDLSEWLQSDRSLGDVQLEEFTEDELQMLEDVGSYDIVESKVRSSFLGHGYYHSNPAVSADLILVLRYGAKAGSDQRPLKHLTAKYWVLDIEAYPSVTGR